MPDEHGMTQISSCSWILWNCHSQNVLLPSVWYIELIWTFVPLHSSPLPIFDSLVSQNYYLRQDLFFICSLWRGILLDCFNLMNLCTYEHIQKKRCNKIFLLFPPGIQSIGQIYGFPTIRKYIFLIYDNIYIYLYISFFLYSKGFPIFKIL